MSEGPRGTGPATFEPGIADYLRREGVEVSAAAGDVLVRRGEQGRAFWAVLEGSVEVRLTAADGVHLTLARLGPAATFGEMALITGESVSADIVALTPVRLLRYPAESFSRALGECAPLRSLVLKRLAANLKDTSAAAWKFSQQARALNVLMGPRLVADPLVAESGAMKAVREAIARRALDRDPVLVSGAPGTGKLFVAAKIHEAAAAPGAPFIAVDCRKLEAEGAGDFLLGSESALAAAGEEDQGSLSSYGMLQLARDGTLVLRHVEAVPAAVQEKLARYLGPRGPASRAQARIVATTDLQASAFATQAAPGLAAALRDGVLPVPRLLDRRKDVLALARLFLAERAERGEKRLSRSAEHLLLSLRYTHRNAAELREALEMAAVISDGGLIWAEHIFTGPKGEGTVHEVNLTGFAAVRNLVRPRVLEGVRAATLGVFAAIVAVSLFLPATGAATVANALTWGFWEPGLFVSFLFLGRIWCTACPLSTAGRLAARLGGAGRSPGAWLKSHGVWFVIAGFLLVIWSEHAFGMTARPQAAGVLLLLLFAAAIASALIWQRETWCRYLCPLGNLGAVCALPAVLSVRSNPSVCAALCTTHECFKGSPAAPGCPVFHHPLYASEAHVCKLCFQCLRVCPHGSARLWLRLPLQSVWAQPDVGGALVPFAVFLVFFAPAMLASQGTSWAATLPGFSATALGALAATAFVSPRLPRLLAGGGEPDPALATRVGLALLVLAWGPAMSFQLGHIGALETLRLHAQPQGPLAGFWPDGGVSLRTIVQVAATFLAAACSAICLVGIRWRLRREGGTLARARWRPLALFCAAYVAGALALLASAP